MAERMQEVATIAAARDLVKAMDIALGNPKPGVNIGAGPHAPIPSAYVPGAVGWTASECEIVADVGSAKALVVFTPGAVAIGKRNVDIGGKIVAVDLTVNVLSVRPDKYQPKKQT